MQMTSATVGDRLLEADSLRAPLLWGVAVGIVQAVSPIGLRWLDQDVVWAVSLIVIAPVYVGFAVADGRLSRVVAECTVALAFVILATVAIAESPWLLVIGLLGHGVKDLWQHRTGFVANTRWWPPFCFAVDLVAAAIVAVLIVAGVDLGS